MYLKNNYTWKTVRKVSFKKPLNTIGTEDLIDY